MTESHPEGPVQPLEQRLSDLHDLVQVITEVNNSLDLGQVLQASLQSIQRVVGGQWGCFLLAQPGTRALQLAHATGLPAPLLESLQALVADSKTLSQAREPDDDRRVISTLTQRVRDLFQAQGIGSFASIPLMARGSAVGMMIVEANPARRLTPPGVDLLASIGEQAGMAIENARLYASLKESEEWYRTFIENSLDGFWEADANGVISFVNDAACRILGVSREEIVGMEAANIAVDPAAARQLRETLYRTGSLVNVTSPTRLKNGEVRILNFTSRVARANPAVPKHQSVFRDVTEQQRLIETLSRRNHELNTLNRVAEILSRPQEIKSALDQVCEQIASITGMETVILYARDPVESALKMVTSYHVPEGLSEGMGRLGLDVPVVHQVAVEGKPVMLDEAGWHPMRGGRAVEKAGYRGGVAVPVMARGAPVGALFVGSVTKPRYELSDVALLLNIGQRIGMALENSNLYTQMERRLQELDGLAQLSAACASSLDPQKLSKMAVEWTCTLLPAQASSLRLVEGDDCWLGAAIGQPEVMVVPERRALNETTRPVVVNRTPVVVTDCETSPQLGPTERGYMRELGMRSVLIVPMPTPDRVMGYMTADQAEPHVWSQREIDLMQTIANQVANSMANAQLFQKVSSEQRKVQAIFDSGLSGLYATDMRGRIVMFNRAAERITGWMSHEVLGKTWQELFSPPGGSGARPLIDEALSGSSALYHPDGGFIQSRDGRILPLAEAAAPLVGEEGRVTGAVGAFWDLTREKAAELNREEFLRMVAHQMRNPLTALLSALELLQGGKLDLDQCASMWSVVKSEGERLNKFSQQFLDLEKTKPTRPVECESLPITPLVREIAGAFQIAHPGRRIRIRSDLATLSVLGDRDRVENVLRNLLDNAVIYSPEKSYVQVVIEAEGEDKVAICVRDQGPGIPVPDQERVFLPFYRVSRPEGHRVYGHGLGLYIARKLAREMEGEVEIENHRGKGSRFRFTLRSAAL